MLGRSRLIVAGVAAVALVLVAVGLRHRAAAPPTVPAPRTDGPRAPLPIGTRPPAGPGVAVELPREAPAGFVAVEPGFFVHEDCLPRVERARSYLRECRAKVGRLTAELSQIASRHRLDLSRDDPFGDLYAVLNSGSAFSKEEALRVGQLLAEWDELKQVTPDGLPLRALAPPSSVIELLETLRRPANAFEFAFWRSALSSELRLGPEEVFDVPDRPDVVAVKRADHPLILAALESWLAPGGPAALALDLLSRNLIATAPEYAEAVDRIGRDAAARLAAGSEDSRTAALGFLRSHLSPRIREHLFSELRRTGSDAAVSALCQALPPRLSVAEASALQDLIRTRSSPAARTAAAGALLRSLPDLHRTEKSDSAAASLLGSLDAAFLVPDGPLGPLDVGSYAIARLGSASADRAPELQRSLEEALSRAAPNDRCSLAARIGGLRTENGARILGRLAGDTENSVAEIGIAHLVEFAAGRRVSGADEVLAGALGSIPEPRALLALQALSAQSPAPGRIPRTLAALQALSTQARSEELRSLARSELARLKR